jgi:MFS family permease
LIAGFGWNALFLINLPLGILALVLAHQYLPESHKNTQATRVHFDVKGTLLLVLTLGCYALSMTLGRGSFGQLNMALLLLALVGVGLFVRTELRTEAPLIRMVTFQNPVLSAGFAMSTLVTTVVMATLVVGPFYLSGALGLDPAHVGLVMSSGPIVAALTGAPAGRLVDRLGADRMGMAGLIGMLIGTSTLSLLPASFGIPGYVVPLVVITGSYALFQAANNTAVMTTIQPDQRGVISGMLNLSRNLGLITGASLMGTVFAMGAGSANLLSAPADSVVSGMRVTFAVAAGLIILALITALAPRAISRHPTCH